MQRGEGGADSVRAEVESKEEGLEEEEEEVGTGSFCGSESTVQQLPGWLSFPGTRKHKRTAMLRANLPGFIPPTRLRRRLRRSSASQEAQFNRTHATAQKYHTGVERTH